MQLETKALERLLVKPQDINRDMSFVSGNYVGGWREFLILIQREASSFKNSSASDLNLSVVIKTVSRHLRRQLDQPRTF